MCKERKQPAKLKTRAAATLASLLTLCATAQAFYSGGTGEPNDPFRISTPADWQELMTTEAHWGKHFLLTNDLDLEGISLTPVGYNPNSFVGVFDGNGHVIRNIDISLPEGRLVGLFGFMRTPGEIKNLTVRDVVVVGSDTVGGLVGTNLRGTISNCCSTGHVAGDVGVGGLVAGNVQGVIEDCYSSVSVVGRYPVGGLVATNNSGDVSNCYSTGSVLGTYMQTGGLIGENRVDGRVTHCRSDASVTGEWSVGGLVGYVTEGEITYSCATGPVNGLSGAGGLVGAIDNGSISNCYATGNVGYSHLVGGLVGYNKEKGIINDCYASGSASGVDYVGGLVGRNAGTISRCYAVGPAIGDPSVGGLVGYNNYGGMTTASFWNKDTSGLDTSAGGIGLTNMQMKTLSTFVGAGWDFVNTWTIDEGHDYPRLMWEGPFCLPGRYLGSGTVDDPFIICSAETLNAIGNNPDDWSKHFILTADIDLSGYTGSEFNAIGSWQQQQPFTGVFDGRNHVISNLTRETFGTISGGLFDLVDGHSTLISDVVLLDVAVICPQGASVGPLVGILDGGTVENCRIERATVVGEAVVGGLIGRVWGARVQRCYSEDVFVSGDWLVGGLIGSNVEGRIQGCYSISSVEGEQGFVGGLLGSNNGGHVENCYAVASVRGQYEVGGLIGDSGSASSSGSVIDSWSAGYVEGIERTGGLVGENRDDISSCYSKADVNATDEVGGLVGRQVGGDISNCYAMGNVSGESEVGGLVGLTWFSESYPGIISKCFSTAVMTGDYWASGGLVGYSIDAIVEDSFWDKDISRAFWSEGGVEKTTEQMQTESTFTSAGWDFADTWKICDGTNYPRLVWQVPLGDVVCPDGVNGLDFAAVAGYWHETDCAALDDCGGADVDLSGGVDFGDVAAVAESWLRGF